MPKYFAYHLRALYFSRRRYGFSPRDIASKPRLKKKKAKKPNKNKKLGYFQKGSGIILVPVPSKSHPLRFRLSFG